MYMSMNGDEGGVGRYSLLPWRSGESKRFQLSSGAPVHFVGEHAFILSKAIVSLELPAIFLTIFGPGIWAHIYIKISLAANTCDIYPCITLEDCVCG